MTISNDDTDVGGAEYRRRFSMSTLYTETGLAIRLPYCNRCGAWIAAVATHIQLECIPVKPPPPPPEVPTVGTVEGRKWLSDLILGHIWEPTGSVGKGRCKCRFVPGFITEADWADHIAEVFYRGTM